MAVVRQFVASFAGEVLFDAFIVHRIFLEQASPGVAVQHARATHRKKRERHGVSAVCIVYIFIYWNIQ